MTFNLGRFITAVAVAIIVGLILVALLGPILASINVPIAVIVGHFFESYGFAIGVLAGILWYFQPNMGHV